MRFELMRVFHTNFRNWHLRPLGHTSRSFFLFMRDVVSCADTHCWHRRIRDALILADDYIGDEWVQFILPGSVDVADTKKSVHRRHRKVLAILPIHTA